MIAETTVELALLLVRLVLFGVFLLAGATKLVNLAGFRKVLPDFGIPGSLSGPVAIVVPIAELILAAALIPAKLAWYAGWGALALFGIFILAVGFAMLRGRKPDCNCFGQLYSAPVGLSTLIRNAVLAVFALSVVVAGRLHSGPELWTWLASLQGNQRKSAIVSGCIILVCFLFVLDRARPEAAEPESVASSDESESTYAEAGGSASSGSVPSAQGIGLPIGTPAPDFALVSLTGDTCSLLSLRDGGKRVLLIFSSPYCDPCAALVPQLMRWMREMENLPNIVLISRGSAKDNMAKVKGFEPSRVLLQRTFEVSDAYDNISTPSGVLVGADGRIQSGLTVGRDAIRDLLAVTASS
jgi:peroxiredoxin